MARMKPRLRLNGVPEVRDAGEGYLTMQHVAEAIGMPYSTVYRKVKNGTIRSKIFRSGLRPVHLIHVDEVNRHLDAIGRMAERFRERVDGKVTDLHEVPA